MHANYEEVTHNQTKLSCDLEALRRGTNKRGSDLKLGP
jgi:hypothetical protein